MKWTKATIMTTTMAEDLISVMLDEIGIVGVEIENNVPLTDEDKDDKGMMKFIIPFSFYVF